MLQQAVMFIYEFAPGSCRIGNVELSLSLKNATSGDVTAYNCNVTLNLLIGSVKSCDRIAVYHFLATVIF
jgi:hypothetical protein